MDDLPKPLVLADVDLRNYPYTPLFRARLFGSTFHAHASDGEWRAGVTLWLKSWDQMPAGSLPDNEVDLCRLAELGRDLKSWNKVRDGAMHGWFKCADGRLYHRVVAEGINEAWNSKAAQRDRTAAARAARLLQRLSQTPENDPAPPVTNSVEPLSHHPTKLNLTEQNLSKENSPCSLRSLAPPPGERTHATTIPRASKMDIREDPTSSRLAASAEIESLPENSRRPRRSCRRVPGLLASLPGAKAESSIGQPSTTTVVAISRAAPGRTRCQPTGRSEPP